MSEEMRRECVRTVKLKLADAEKLLRGASMTEEEAIDVVMRAHDVIDRANAANRVTPPNHQRSGKTMRDDAWRYAVLSYDFDASSKDNYIQARFKNDIVRARAQHACATCLGAIDPGTLYRLEVVKMDGEMLTARHCIECCDAMATWPDTDDMEQRYALGERRHKEQREVTR